IILLDINLPDCNGIELCLTLKQQFPNIGIIALSTYNQPGIINKMLYNGADSYLLKNASSKYLLKTIENVASGKKLLTEEIKNIIRESLQNTCKNTVITK